MKVKMNKEILWESLLISLAHSKPHSDILLETLLQPHVYLSRPRQRAVPP